MTRTMLKGCAAVAAMAMAAGGAVAQDSPVALNFGHWVPATHPLQELGMTEWAESVTEASGGTISVNFFPAQQMGQAADHYDMARDGIVDIAFINPGYQPGRFPIIAAGEIPFTFSNGTGGSAALDAWYRTYAEEEMSDVYYCLSHLHAPGTFHSSEPIRVPGDVEGMNVRPAHATMASFVNMLGGQNFQVSAPESRDALERGIADAITFPWNSILIFGIDEAVSYHLDIPLYATTFAWVMNQSTYDGMSQAQQEVIDNHCNPEWAERVATGWAGDEMAGRAEIMGLEGHEIITPSQEDVAAWQEAAAPLVDEWIARMDEAGMDGQAMHEALLEEVAARGAAY